MEFAYSSETGRPTADKPARFLHVQVLQQEAALPRGVKPTTLGGKRGLFAPANSKVPDGTYFGNHVRFFWTEGGVKYAASLHNFGAATKQVLGALLKDLRPADEFAARRSDPPGTNTIPVPVPGPAAMTATPPRVWVSGPGEGGNPTAKAAAIDAKTARAVSPPRRLSFGLLSSAVSSTSSGGSVWVSQSKAHSLCRINARSGRLTARISSGPRLVGLAASRGRLWGADFGSSPFQRRLRVGSLKALDTDTLKFTVDSAVGRAPIGVATDARSVWVTNSGSGTVTRLNGRNGRVEKTIRVGSIPTGIVRGGGALWVANTGDNTVSRLDPKRSKVVRTVRVGRGPRALAFSRTAVWVANYLDDTVSRIDPRGNRVTRIIPVGAGPIAIAAGSGRIWVANLQDRSVTRLTP